MSTINGARKRAHLSRHERQRLARVDAFSRRTPASVPALPAVALDEAELAVIDRLAREERAAVSSALLAVAGIGASGSVRRAVLGRVGEAAVVAEAEGAIGRRRARQIARHVGRALT